MKNVIKELKERFPISVIEEKREDLAFLKISKEQAVAFITYLRDNQDFTHLVFLTAVDYIERNIFSLTYMLRNYDLNTDLGVHVEIERENASMETVHHLWEQAGTYQRELKEMFGIDFPGSPRVDEPFILEGWDNIPPMRRDFDTKEYSDKTYFPREGRKTHDPREYMKEKLYPGGGDNV